MAREYAAEAVMKFEAAATTGRASDIAKLGKQHRMTQRFLLKSFKGDCPTDVPLRPMLDEFLGLRNSGA